MSEKKGAVSKKKLAVFITKIVAFALLCGILLMLIINALLCIFNKNYYPTFGRSRLFVIASDSMEPEIPTGCFILSRLPKDESEIEVGTVITYRYQYGKNVMVITHRVTQIKKTVSGATCYVTRGDNAPAIDAVQPTFSDVIGIYTGKKCKYLGYVVGFFQSTQGVVTLIIFAFIIGLTAIMLQFLKKARVFQDTAISAMKKCEEMLADPEREGTDGTVAEVLRIISDDSSDSRKAAENENRLKQFAETGELPAPSAELPAPAAEPPAEEQNGDPPSEEGDGQDKNAE